MSVNEFDCLTNTLLQAGLRNDLPVAFAVPAMVRDILQANQMGVKDVRAVHLHQCPKEQGIIDYRLEIYGHRGLVKLETFQGSGLGRAHDTYELYDRRRDGPMKHLHLVH